MPPLPPSAARAEQRRQTEARILAAAQRMFAESGYDRTTIRAIAAAANVDAGLVMHYFGNKETLFLRCTDGPVPAPPPNASGDELAEFVLSGVWDSLGKDPAGLAALFRSMMTHPEAASSVRSAIADYLGPLTAAIDADHAGMRGSLVAAILLGVGVGRMLEIGEIADATPELITDLLRPTIRALVNPNPEPAP